MTVDDNVQTIIDTAVEAHSFKLNRIEDFADAALTAIVPQGAEAQVIDLEKFQPNPRQKSGSVVLHTASSFAAYVSAHKQSGTALFADRYQYAVAAVIDGHDVGEDGKAGWGKHKASYTARKTPEWQSWVGANGRMMTQAQFAEFIEDNLDDIDPNGSPSPAEMYELARTFQVKTRVDFESEVKIESGETRLEYNETHQSKAGQKGEITIPQSFTLVLRPFEDFDLFRVTARFRYRLDRGNLTLGFDLVKPDVIERIAFMGKPANEERGTEAVDGIVQAIERDTGLNAFYGTR